MPPAATRPRRNAKRLSSRLGESKEQKVTTPPLRNDPQSQVRLVRAEFDAAQSRRFKTRL